jgi:hypothetical protein
MENLLLKYMGEVLNREPIQVSSAVKPIVTISREYGCQRNDLMQPDSSD